MIINGIYIILAFLGLGFLIFIHELGHYFMARRVGMKVEVFSIGFGKPVFSWMFQGVKWQLAMLPFGGFVKISGERDDGKEPEPDSFYGKRPIDRIKVALMGPIVNIVFAFLLFTVIWMTGGRDEPFAKHTSIIGYVDPASELYAKGVRPGDQISTYNHHTFHGFKDLLYASVLNQPTMDIEGYKINYYTDTKEPFHYHLNTYADPRSQNQDVRTIGIMTPASVLVFGRDKASDFPFDESPMKDSGIAYGDRIVWANGELIFSMQQLSLVVNEPKALLTISREGQHFLAKVPRLKVGDLRLSAHEKVELEDWQHQIKAKGSLKDLFYIPYVVSSHGIIEKAVNYIGEDSEEHTVYDDFDTFLKAGDKIVAVDGIEVGTGYQTLQLLQKKRVRLIVERDFNSSAFTWKNENDKFITSFEGKDLEKLTSSFILNEKLTRSANLHLLNSVEPVLLSDLPLTASKKNWLVKDFLLQQERIEKIKNPQMRLQALKMLEKNKQKLVLGVPLSDVSVAVNPNPFVLFSQVLKDTGRTLSSLVTGKLNPKWMSGPIGMVQIMHHGWSEGVKEALFWMATISMSLGVFNLFPLPVLDGGNICFSLYEIVTRRKLKPKTMEKLIVPFLVGLVALFIYVTYQDVIRLFGRFF